MFRGFPFSVRSLDGGGGIGQGAELLVQLGRERELGLHRPEIIKGRGLLRFQDEPLNRLDPLGEGAVENILVADLVEDPGQSLALLVGDLVVLGGVLHADAGGAEGVADFRAAPAGGLDRF